VTAHQPEQFLVRSIADEPDEKARLGSHIAEERVPDLPILREACRVTRRVSSARLVLDRRLRWSQEHLLWEIDWDLRSFQLFRSARHRKEVHSTLVAAKEDPEVATRAAFPRPALRPSGEDQSVVELARLDEDLVPKYKIPERSHQRCRRPLEHPDDDAIVDRSSSTSHRCLGSMPV